MVRFLQVNLEFLKLHHPCLIFQAKKQKSEDIGISSISEEQVIITFLTFRRWGGGCSYIRLHVANRKFSCKKLRRCYTTRKKV